MKAKIILIFTAVLVSSCSTTTSVNDSTETWSINKRLSHLQNIQNPAAWDHEMLEMDKQMIGLRDFGPFELGAFPVPDYEILGKESFKGIGNKSSEFKINNKALLMNSFFVEKNTLNKNRLEEKKDEVFFHIIVLTDTIDNENYELNRSVVISRNHPDYLGQGFMKTKELKIDYLAFKTAENHAFAVVNTRLFNLNFGKTILIAPQKDKTLRSMQIEVPQLTSESVIQATNNLIKQQEIIDFFDLKSNI